MTSSARLAPVVLLTLSVSPLAACADRAAGVGDVPETEVDARAYCPDVDAGPIAPIASRATAVTAGPCGHLVYTVDNAQAYLHTPGAEPEAIDAEAWAAVFAPTGHLVAFEHAEVEGVALRDLITGEQTELPRAERIGFVPAPDAEHGADLWTCADETLELAGPAATAVVAEGVDCSSVVGSSGSPRVAFAGTDHVVRFADLEALEVWELDDADYVGDGFDGRDDWLWIDYDGVVVSHRMLRWDSEPGSDAEYEVLLGVRVFAAGEQLADWVDDAPWSWPLQAATRGAPVLLRPAGRVSAIVDSARHDHTGEFGSLELDRSGRAVTIDEAAGELLRVPRDGSLETLAGELEPTALRVSRSGEWVALELRGDACLEDELGECEWLLGTLALWHEGEGLRAAGRPGLRWELLGVNDAGQMLVLGTALEPGATPDPLPEPELVLLDAELQPLGTWPAPAGFTRTVAALDDGRFVVELHATGVGDSGQLLLADPAQGLAPIAAAAGVDHNQVWIDATNTKLAFVTHDADGVPSLLAGAMPD